MDLPRSNMSDLAAEQCKVSGPSKCHSQRLNGRALADVSIGDWPSPASPIHGVDPKARRLTGRHVREIGQVRLWRIQSPRELAEIRPRAQSDVEA